MESAALVLGDRLKEIEELTRRFATFSYSAAGLGNVLGGAMALFACVAHQWLPLTPVVRAVLVTTPFVWIVGKELLRRRFYQRYGRVSESVSSFEWGVRCFCNLFVIAISIGVFVHGILHAEEYQTVPLVIALAITVSLPFLLWFMRAPLEFIVGVFLFTQATIAAVGHRDLQAPTGLWCFFRSS